MFLQNLLAYAYQDLYRYRLVPYTNTLLHQALSALENMHLKLCDQHNRICHLIMTHNVRKAYQYIASNKINADFNQYGLPAFAAYFRETKICSSLFSDFAPSIKKKLFNLMKFILSTFLWK